MASKRPTKAPSKPAGARKKPAGDYAGKPGPKPQAVAESYTVARFATLAGFDRHTLAARMKDMKLRPVGTSPGQGADVFALRDLVRGVMGGDIEAERLRKTREEADKLALANARTKGELVELASVRRLGEKVMAAVRNRILAMPLTDEEKDGCLRELLALADIDWSRTP